MQVVPAADPGPAGRQQDRREPRGDGEDLQLRHQEQPSPLLCVRLQRDQCCQTLSASSFALTNDPLHCYQLRELVLNLALAPS
jgi:hypothetical protein